MGFYKYLGKLLKSPEQKKRLVKWRKQGSIVRVDKPTRLDRARRVGYKAKQGVSVYRVRIKKGARKREHPHKGRKPKKAGLSKYTPKISFRTVAEQRCQRKHPGLRVLNSYMAGDDAKHVWFEIIMIDMNLQQIRKDKDYYKLCTSKHRGRVHRGLTASGRKGRGLKNKGKGAEKVRPSIRAKKTQGK